MDKYIPCRWMTSFVYLRNLATSDIPISGFPGWLKAESVPNVKVVAANADTILVASNKRCNTNINEGYWANQWEALQVL